MTYEPESEREWRLCIDLRGATRCDPSFLSVDMRGALPASMSVLELRQGAAEHFGLPLERIPEPTFSRAPVHRVPESMSYTEPRLDA